MDVSGCLVYLVPLGTLCRPGRGQRDGVGGRRCEIGGRGWLGGMNWAGPWGEEERKEAGREGDRGKGGGGKWEGEARAGQCRRRERGERITGKGAKSDIL